MLSDRPYMRGHYQREKTSVLTWIVSALIAGFVIQLVLGSTWIGGHGRVADFMGLSVRALTEFRVWTLLTHALLHSETFPLHVVFNVLALYFLGRELVPMLGTRRFVGVIVAATIVGGLAWAGVHWNGAPEMHIGTSAAVLGLFTIFACLFPNQPITFLLFFVVPVTLRPKHVTYFLFGLSLLGLLVYELPGAELPLGMVVASSAHLGGMLTGFVYYRFVHDGRWAFASPDRGEVELPRWLKRNRKPAPATASYAVTVDTATPVRDKENIRAEVDRILDKINSEGFAALTPAEKRILDDAKHLLSRR